MERIDEDSISIHNDTVALSSTESSSDNENENLAFYVNNRVKILQRMFKVLHTRKIMKMAPACLKVIPDLHPFLLQFFINSTIITE